MQIKFLPEQNFELLSEISIRKNFSSISFFSKVQRVRIRRRNTTLIWKLKNIFEELSFYFPFLQFAIHRAIPCVARKNNVETKIGKFLERIGKVSIEDRFFPPSHPLLRPLRRVSSRESFLFQPTIEKFPSKISCRWEVLLNNVYARSFVRLPSLLHFPRPILRLQLVNSLENLKPMRDSLVTWCGEKYVVDREFETIAYFGWVFPGGASLCFEKFIFLEAEMSGIFMISRQYLRIFVDQGENESKRNSKKCS